MTDRSADPGQAEIHGQVDATLARLTGLYPKLIDLSLGRMRRLLADLENPETRLAPVIHVAGTNGKGSTIAIMRAVLEAAGYRVHVYTSPHLVRFAERIRLVGGLIDEHLLLALLEHVETANAGQPITFFEVTTAVAFMAFARIPADVVLLETGLGGRFDATNVMAPAAGAITTIGLDHQQYLGHTLQEIAFEKAGIIKTGMTMVAGALRPDAMAIIRRACAERGARLIETAALGVRSEMVDGRAQVWWHTASRSYGPVTLALRGEHQVGNAVVAAALLEAAAEAGVPVKASAIERGLASASWPARLERFSLEAGQQVILDAAHNADGAEALARYLRRWHPRGGPCLVVGIMRDKDVDLILRALLPVAASVVVTAAATPRALPASDLAARVSALAQELGLSHPAPMVVPDPRAAVSAALSISNDVCVAGSIFLVGAVRDHLAARAILP